MSIPTGIELKFKEMPEPHWRFSYRPAGISPPISDQGIKWTIVALQKTYLIAQHLRCHELQPGDDLRSLVAEYQSKDALAVIVVNYDGSSVFEHEEQKTEIPVVVLRPEDGKSFQAAVRDSSGTELVCRILADSQHIFSPESSLLMSRQGE